MQKRQRDAAEAPDHQALEANFLWTCQSALKSKRTEGVACGMRVRHPDQVWITCNVRQILSIFAVTVPALHGVCLACTRLAIGKNGAVETIQHLLHDGGHSLIIQARLA